MDGDADDRNEATLTPLWLASLAKEADGPWRRGAGRDRVDMNRRIRPTA